MNEFITNLKPTALIKKIYRNSFKIIITIFFISTFSYNILSLQEIKKDILFLHTSSAENLTATKTGSILLFRAMEILYEQLNTISDQQQFIIDQNRIKANQEATKNTSEKTTKPTYEELKSHTVLIYGCSSEEAVNEKLSSNTSSSGMCWSGTGVVIKVTETETYILTNNHVAGKKEKDPILFVANESGKVRAELVKYNDYVDAAVIKITGKLEHKTPITKISYVNIQDPVYIVGNPLGNKMIYTEGVVAGYTGISVLIQAPCIYGNSGSGIFNSNGELVGLVYALQMYNGFMGIPEAQITHTVAVDAISIYMFLKDLGLYNDPN